MKLRMTFSRFQYSAQSRKLFPLASTFPWLEKVISDGFRYSLFTHFSSISEYLKKSVEETVGMVSSRLVYSFFHRFMASQRVRMSFSESPETLLEKTGPRI